MLPGGVRPLADLPVEGRRVFVRVDFNVPMKQGRITDDARIVAALPTIQELLRRGAKTILASHLGRPDGKPDPAFSLEPVAARLAELTGQDVTLADEPVGDGARRVASDVRDGELGMLENMRFDPREEANDPVFAKELSTYCDVYVNDAFGAAHRAHASTAGIAAHVIDKGAGLLMAKEIDVLSRLLDQVAKPYVAVVGGAKVSDKVDVLDALLFRVSHLIVGGAMANTFLAAQGRNMGKSKIEADKLAAARLILKRASERGVTVLLPDDVIAASSLDAPAGSVVDVADMPADLMALDIGPRTLLRYQAVLKDARAVFWNGPMGVFEKAPFAAGTMGIAHAMAENTNALTVVGGGDSAAAAAVAGVTEKVTHVSTGGGASLEFVQGLRLPGIVALAT